MSWTDVSNWKNKKQKLEDLIRSVDNVLPNNEEVLAYLSPAYSYMQGNMIGNRSYDNDALKRSFQNYTSIKLTLDGIKQAAQTKIRELESKITNETARLQEQQRRENEMKIEGRKAEIEYMQQLEQKRKEEERQRELASQSTGTKEKLEFRSEQQNNVQTSSNRQINYKVVSRPRGVDFVAY